MAHRPRSIIEPEDEVAFVRDCLLRLARGMQSRGEIPPDISQAELYAEVEKHVPQILSAVQRNAMYHEWKRTGHLEEHIRQLVQVTLTTPSPNPPPAAKDQITYVNTKTGQSLSPTWKHQGCGGTVYPSDQGNTFRCNRCKKTGQLGADMPENLSRKQQMEYMITQVEEVDLT